MPDCFNPQICSGNPVGPQINRGSPQISTQAQTAHACEMFIAFNPGDSASLSVNHGTWISAAISSSATEVAAS